MCSHVQGRLDNSIELLKAQADVAQIEQPARPGASWTSFARSLPALDCGCASDKTPKDEQNARISEREKYLAVIDAAFQLHQAEISLLRQNRTSAGLAGARRAYGTWWHSVYPTGSTLNCRRTRAEYTRILASETTSRNARMVNLRHS